MGCLIGGVAQFKNQNEVNHLPLELSADEVTLAAQQGWVTLLPDSAVAVVAAMAMREHGPAGRHVPRQQLHADLDWEAYYEYYSQFDPQHGFTGNRLPLLGAKRRLHQQKQQQQQQQRQAVHGLDAATAEPWSTAPAVAVADAAARDHSEPGWRAAVSEGAQYTIPLTAAEAAACRSGAPGAAAAGGEALQGGSAAVGNADRQVGQAGGGSSGSMGTSTSATSLWQYPSTELEQLRFAVFCDLHRQGYMMTGGIKFGADMLAYPGDPSLYHAQFTVRLVTDGTALNPMLLKATARGSHAARKHLLLASWSQDLDAEGKRKIRYLSIAPEAGFGSKA